MLHTIKYTLGPAIRKTLFILLLDVFLTTSSPFSIFKRQSSIVVTNSLFCICLHTYIYLLCDIFHKLTDSSFSLRHCFYWFMPSQSITFHQERKTNRRGSKSFVWGEEQKMTEFFSPCFLFFPLSCALSLSISLSHARDSTVKSAKIFFNLSTSSILQFAASCRIWLEADGLPSNDHPL